MKKWFFAMLLLVTGVAHAALLEGRDYTRLAVPQPVANHKKIEVIEFFSYTCVHCYDLDASMMSWAKKQPADIDFKRVQIVWGDQMAGFAKFFATMNALNLTDKLDQPAFNAVMKQRTNLADPAKLTAWLKTQPGVNVTQFMQTFNSFGINAKLAEAKQKTRDYAIQATPTIVVNGKFVMQPAEPKVLLQNLNQLIAMIHKGLK